MRKASLLLAGISIVAMAIPVYAYPPGTGGYGHMGPGMMGCMGGYGSGMMGPGMMYYGHSYQLQQPLTSKDAGTIIENYLKATRNPNLKMGKTRSVNDGFEVEIVTKENSLVDIIHVDKNTGWMSSIY